jgi:hypothetical protein
MSCTSYVFRHKHIGENPDNQASIIERSILWREDSWEIGHFLTCCFDLPNGGYIYRDADSLKEIIQEAISGEDWEEHDKEALVSLTSLLDTVDDDDLFVSVDY